MGTERPPADRASGSGRRVTGNGTTARPKRANSSSSRAGGSASGGANNAGTSTNALPGDADSGATPASRRALRNQGRRTMRKLLDAALVAFERRGYHATRVNDVVEIAKTSHGTFYLYFSNKEDLLRALVAEAAAEAQHLYNSLTAAPEAESSWEDLRVWVGQYSTLWSHYAPLLRAWTDLSAIDVELGLQVRDTVAALAGALSARIAAVPHDEPVDASVAGLAVLAMLERFHYLREFMGEQVDDASLDTLTTIVHRALFDTTGTAAPAARH